MTSNYPVTAALIFYAFFIPFASIEWNRKKYAVLLPGDPVR